MHLRLVFDPDVALATRSELVARLKRVPGCGIDHAVAHRAAPTGTYEELWTTAREFSYKPLDVVGLIVATRLPDNFFARSPEGPDACRLFAVHVDDFSWFTPAPTAAVLAHLVAKKLLDVAAEQRGLRHMSLFHDDVELGCAFDLCAFKGELVRRLRSGDICSRCLTALEDAGVEERLIRYVVSVLQETRRDALHASRFLPDPVASEVQRWPFPVAVTRHKASNERGERRLNMLLDHFDSLVRYSCIVGNALAGRSMHDVLPGDSPTLGWWVSELGRLGRSISQLRHAHRIAEREHVVAVRNDNAHSWSLPDGSLETAEAVTQLQGALSAIEEALEPWFASHQLTIVKRDAIRFSGRSLTIRVELAHGSNTIFESREVCLPESASPASIGVTVEGGAEVLVASSDLSRFTTLAPLIVYDVCGRCGHPAILVADSGGKYIDPRVGHRGPRGRSRDS